MVDLVLEILSGMGEDAFEVPDFVGIEVDHVDHRLSKHAAPAGAAGSAWKRIRLSARLDTLREGAYGPGGMKRDTEKEPS